MLRGHGTYHRWRRWRRPRWWRVLVRLLLVVRRRVADSGVRPVRSVLGHGHVSLSGVLHAFILSISGLLVVRVFLDGRQRASAVGRWWRASIIGQRLQARGDRTFGRSVELLGGVRLGCGSVCGSACFVCCCIASGGAACEEKGDKQQDARCHRQSHCGGQARWLAGSCHALANADHDVDVAEALATESDPKNSVDEESLHRTQTERPRVKP